MSYRIKFYNVQKVFFLFLFVMGLMMLHTSVYCIKNHEDWYKVIFFLLYSIFMFFMLGLSLREKNYVTLFRDRLVIHATRTDKIIMYNQIEELKSFPSNKQELVIKIKNKRKKIRFKMYHSKQLVDTLNSIVNNEDLQHYELPLDLLGVSKYTKPISILYPRWVYLMLSFLFISGCSLLYYYTINQNKSNSWFPIIIALLAAFCICAMTIHQISLDERGIKITCVFPFCNKVIPWEKIQGIRYKNDEKVPFYQPGHGPKSKTVILTLAGNREYYFSIKEHKQFYHVVQSNKKIEAKLGGQADSVQWQLTYFV